MIGKFKLYSKLSIGKTSVALNEYEDLGYREPATTISIGEDKVVGEHGLALSDVRLYGIPLNVSQITDIIDHAKTGMLMKQLGQISL